MIAHISGNGSGLLVPVTQRLQLISHLPDLLDRSGERGFTARNRKARNWPQRDANGGAGRVETCIPAGNLCCNHSSVPESDTHTRIRTDKTGGKHAAWTTLLGCQINRFRASEDNNLTGVR